MLNILTSPSLTLSPKPTTELLLSVKLETFWPVMPVWTPPGPPLPLMLRWSSVTPETLLRLMPPFAALLNVESSTLFAVPLPRIGVGEVHVGQRDGLGAAEDRTLVGVLDGAARTRSRAVAGDRQTAIGPGGAGVVEHDAVGAAIRADVVEGQARGADIGVDDIERGAGRGGDAVGGVGGIDGAAIGGVEAGMGRRIDVQRAGEVDCRDAAVLVVVVEIDAEAGIGDRAAERDRVAAAVAGIGHLRPSARPRSR